MVLEDIVPGMLGGVAALAFADNGVAWTLDVPLDKISGAEAGNSGARQQRSLAN